MKTPRALAACLAIGLPLLAVAVTTARQDFMAILALNPVESHGGELFEQCVACHGASGGGTVDGSTPRIAGQHYRVIVTQLVDFRHGRRWDFRMEGVATDRHGLVDAQDIADVADYVSKLEVQDARGVGDGQFVDQGAAIYAANCQSCHGEKAQGDNTRLIPRLAGQHAAYLMRQIYNAVDGRRPTLSRAHTQSFKSLEFEQVSGLTDYLARIGWKTEQPHTGGGGVEPAPK
jgi:cytochrome c553